MVAIRLVLYIVTSFGNTIYEMYNSGLWLAHHEHEILHQIVYMIILVKAYKILMFYAEHHHINIKYITELMIISCFIEFIFNFQTLDLYRLIVLGIAGIFTLLLYVKYYDKLEKMEDK